MRESTLTARILRELNNAPGCMAIKTHGGRFGRAGTPDIVGCYQGRAFLLEVKVGGNAPTRLQEHEMESWDQSGAAVEVAREGFDVAGFLKRAAHKSDIHTRTRAGEKKVSARTLREDAA